MRLLLTASSAGRGSMPPGCVGLWPTVPIIEGTVIRLVVVGHRPSAPLGEVGRAAQTDTDRRGVQPSRPPQAARNRFQLDK